MKHLCNLFLKDNNLWLTEKAKKKKIYIGNYNTWVPSFTISLITIGIINLIFDNVMGEKCS